MPGCIWCSQSTNFAHLRNYFRILSWTINFTQNVRRLEEKNRQCCSWQLYAHAHESLIFPLWSVDCCWELTIMHMNHPFFPLWSVDCCWEQKIKIRHYFTSNSWNTRICCARSRNSILAQPVLVHMSLCTVGLPLIYVNCRQAPPIRDTMCSLVHTRCTTPGPVGLSRANARNARSTNAKLS